METGVSYCYISQLLSELHLVQFINHVCEIGSSDCLVIEDSDFFGLILL